MKKSISDFLGNRKAEVVYRTERTQAVFGAPPLSASPVVYEIAEKTQTISQGGATAIVFESNKRYNQENLIGRQRKGVASWFDATASA